MRMMLQKDLGKAQERGQRKRWKRGEECSPVRIQEAPPSKSRGITA